jgi:hypothetical protein
MGTELIGGIVGVHPFSVRDRETAPKDELWKLRPATILPITVR